jgi:L-xylulokinase
MDLLDVSELAESLAPLKQSTDLAGHVSARAASETGLLEGTPVFVGGHDICVTPIGVGAPDPSVMMAAFGTWSIATLNVSDTEGLPLVINAAAPNSFITGIGDGNAGAALDTMLAQNFQDYFAIAAKKGLSVHQYLESLITADDRNSLIFIPHLFGNFLNADASASLLGLRFHTQRTDILKAIIEGIVLGYRANLSLFPQLEHVRTIWLSGGGGRSNIIGQVMADVFQKTVLVPEDYELSARGAAVAAYVGSGTSELADAPRARVRRQFDPRPKMVSYYGPKLEILSKVLLEGNEIIAAIGALKV